MMTNDCPICRGIGKHGEPPIYCQWCKGSGKGLTPININQPQDAVAVYQLSFDSLDNTQSWFEVSKQDYEKELSLDKRTLYTSQPNDKAEIASLTKQRDDWQNLAGKWAEDEARLREVLERIAKFQASKPQPDPHAHSWKAFAEHTMAYATDMKFIAINALAMKGE